MRDLISEELAVHRSHDPLELTYGARCHCGWQGPPRSESSRLARTGDHEDHVADQIIAAIEASQPDHIIEFDARDDGWAMHVQHSMACRLAGKLLDCPTARASNYLGVAGWDGRVGRYRVAVDEATGKLVVGELESDRG